MDKIGFQKYRSYGELSPYIETKPIHESQTPEKRLEILMNHGCKSVHAKRTLQQKKLLITNYLKFKLWEK
jgi:hypothetical protein